MARIKYIFVLLIVSLTISNSIECEYDKCPDPWNPDNFIDHTMCQYSEASFGPACNNDVRFSSLEYTEQQAILNLHNELRAQVAAGKESQGSNGGQPAGIIGPLEWDNELALIAQRWANQCEFGHDKCRNIGEIRIGQNLGYQASEGGFNNKFVDIVTSWYDEVKNFDGTLVANYQSRDESVTTHYTQLIWAKTTHVGCGGVKYFDGEYYKIHLVCNYSPGGNTIGESVYSINTEPQKQFDDNSHDNSDQYSDDNPHVDVPPNEHALEPTYLHPTIVHRSFPQLPTDDATTDTPHNFLQPFCLHDKCKDENGAYENHTMSQYPSPDTDVRCNQVDKPSLTDSDINEILKVHIEMNRNRNQLAHGKRSIKWNTDLAAIAQRWANQCLYQHDICRDICGFKVEQNIAQISGDTVEFTDIVKSWYDELQRHESSQKYSNDQDIVSFLFTKLDWVDAAEVGCGGIKYRGTDGNSKTYLVCNYLAIDSVYHFDEQPSDFTVVTNDRYTEACQYRMCANSQNQYYNHTMCEYPTSSVGEACHEPLQSSLSQMEKDELLKEHNTIRKYASIQVRSLKWNDELAEIAQRWANQCLIGNDKCRNLVDGSNVGQNIGLIKRKRSLQCKFIDVIDSWVDMAYQYNNQKSEYASESNSNMNFYQQMISNKITDVGCGGVKYTDSDEYLNTYLVCNYSPEENMIGESVYPIHSEPQKQFDNNPYDYSNHNSDDNPHAGVPPNEPALEPTYLHPTIVHRSSPQLSTDDATTDTPHNFLQPFCLHDKCKDENGAYENHTMSQYPSPDTDVRCNQVDKPSLTDSDIREILKVHIEMNRNRSQLAHGKRLIKWNTDLAAIAQRWANQCLYQHDICRDICGFKVEQNVGQISDDTVEFTDIVKSWYDELQRHESSQKYSNDQDIVSFLFTKLDWVDAAEVGCGGIKYRGTDGNSKTYLVCNYLAIDSVHHFDEQPSDFTVVTNDRYTEACQYRMCANSQNQYYNHTMCEYPTSSVSEACHEPLQSSLSQVENNRLLEAHNDIRQRTNSHIRPLKWNDELAEIAQRWANQCLIGNDKCRNLVDGSNVGQNIGLIKREHPLQYEFLDVIYSWAHVTYHDFTLKSESASVSNPHINFYEQMISDKTTDVGCGGIKYTDSDEYLNTYLVCNYSPSGPNSVKINYHIHNIYSADIGLP